VTASLVNRWLPQQDVPPALHGVALKLNRAAVHLDELNRIVRSLRAGFSAAVQMDRREDNRVDLRLEGAPALPEDLPAIVGDVAHNLRSALDHLAWQLVLLHGGTPTRRTRFPLMQRRHASGELPNIEGGVSDTTRKLLDEVQPYTWGDDGHDPAIAPLAVLNALSNVDKHRELVVGIAVVDSGSWSNDLDTTARFLRDHRSVADGDSLGYLLVDGTGEIHDIELTFAVRFLEDTELDRYAQYDVVEWAMNHAFWAVEYAVMSRFLPLFTQ
jgi:hypothetical protein